MKVNIQSITDEITNYINEQNRILQTYGDKKFIGYHWTCQYLDVQNDVIEKVCIKDNHGDRIIITCEIYIDDYLSDDHYQQEELDELCIVLFDEYDWKML